MVSRIYFTILVVFVLTFTYSDLFSQKAVIEGITFDQEANAPLEFTSVSLYSLPDSSLVNGVITDEKGYFKFERLSAGKYYVLAQFMGYSSFSSPALPIADGQKLNVGNLNLQIDQQFLTAVQITGQTIQSSNKIDKQVYKADQFDAAKGGTAIDILKNMPSVAVDGQGEISVRGSKGFLVLINGKPVQTDAQTMLSQLPANTVENVELITAPSAKYDADGKGGIINITTKQGASDGIAFIANTKGGFPSVDDYGNKRAQQRYGADITFNYKRNKWDISAAANYLRNDNAGFREGDVFTIIENRKTVFPSNGERSFDKHNYGGRLNIGFDPSKTDQFSAGFFAGHKFQDRLADIYYNNVKTSLDSNTPISQNQYFNSNLQNKQGDFFLGNFDYTHLFPNESSVSFSVLYEHANLFGSTRNRNIEFIDTAQNTISSYKNPLNGLRAKVDYGVIIGKGKLEAGYQYRKDEQDGDFVYSVKETGDDNFQVVPEFTGRVKAVNDIHSLYTQYSATLNKLEYIAGLRYEYATRDLNVRSGDDSEYRLELNNFFPSASILYTFDANWKLKAGISRRVQRTNNFELNPIPEREHSETLEQGDANLLPEFIYLAEAGLIRTFGKGSLFSTVYYQNIKNPIQRVNSVYADTILNRVYTNADKASRLGLELGIDYSPVKWTRLYLGTNVYRSVIHGVILNYPNNLQSAGWVYSINGNSDFQVTPTFSVQGNVNYLSDRPTVQGEDSRFLSPNISLKKTFFDGRFTALLQWQNIDLGLFGTNQQRITTSAPDFYTTTNYIYETDVFMLNLSFNLNKSARKIKLPVSEFGEKEF